MEPHLTGPVPTAMRWRFKEFKKSKRNCSNDSK